VLREPGAPREMDRYPPDLFAPPHGNFVLLLRDGIAIGGGAFMRHDERTAELKRVWTHTDLRRQGLASKVLLELEAQVRRQGYERICLTTGFRQPEAVGPVPRPWLHRAVRSRWRTPKRRASCRSKSTWRWCRATMASPQRR
jgi:GNAT superfamily N-acetyltransferase